MPQEQLVLLVAQVPQEVPVLQALRALREPQAQCLDQQDLLDQQALQALLEPQERRVQQD